MTTNIQRALVADDEAGIRYYFVACLKRLGFECDEAQSGEEAIEKAENEDFDIILIDVRMPGMGGLEALRKLRENGVKAKIIVLSALGGPEIAATAVADMGADAFVAKPCTIAELQQATMNVGAAA